MQALVSIPALLDNVDDEDEKTGEDIEAKKEKDDPELEQEQQ